MTVFAFKRFIQIDCFGWRSRKDLSGTVRGIFQMRYDSSLDWDGNIGNGEQKDVKSYLEGIIGKTHDWLLGAKVGKEGKCQG